MAGQDLSELGNLQIRMRPRKTGIYVAKQSYPDGVVPQHLESYTEDFSDAAHDCESVMDGLKGNKKVEAFNACIAQKLK